MKHRLLYRRLAFILALALSIASVACAPTAVSPPMASPPAPTTALTALPATAPATSAPVEPAPTEAPTAEPLPEPTLVLTDGLSRTVTLAGPATRIVSLAPSNTELVFAIGAGDQLVGRDNLSDYPPEAAEVSDIGGTYEKLNTEAIVSLQPDLVLAAEINSAEQVQSLEDLGLTVYWLGNPDDFEGLYENLRIVGQLTGHQQDAESLAVSLQNRIDAVREKVMVSSLRPKVFYELDATDPTKPWTTGPGTFIHQLIDQAGGHNIGSVLSEQYVQISSEELVSQDPDIILLGDAKFGITVESVGQRAGWEGIAAVENGKIYPFDDDLASRPGPRLVDGLEEMAKLIHPELFEE